MHLNNNMQKFISQIPQLAAYLSRLPKIDQIPATKQLIKLGLQTVQQNCCKQNNQQNNITDQIHHIKQNLQELNHMVKCQNHHCCGCYYPRQQRPQLAKNYYQDFEQPQQDNNINNTNQYTFEPRKERFRNEIIPTKQGANQTGKRPLQRSEVNPFVKDKKSHFRHHLDDKQVKQVLTYPASSLIDFPKPQRKSQEYKQHEHQDEINRQELLKIKQERGESEQIFQRTRATTDYHKATSKIKSLLDKDRIRYTQRQRDESFKQGFNKYEYSDENQMEESSISEERPQKQAKQPKWEHPQQNTYNQSSFKASQPASSSQKSKPSSKKQFQHSKKEVSSKLQVSNNEVQSVSKHSSNEGSMPYRTSEKGQFEQAQEDDVISNSSSFSQFSINGSRKRDVGKISRRSNN